MASSSRALALLLVAASCSLLALPASAHRPFNRIGISARLERSEASDAENRGGAQAEVELASDEMELKVNFDAFLAKFEKKHAYQGAEYAHRMKVFGQNLKLAAERQKDDTGSAVHGVTRFFDLTPEEFKKEYLGLSFTPETARRDGVPVIQGLDTGALPEDFDWRKKGAVTPVKNQGQCGSCWSFSTTGAIEGASFIKTGKLPNLSEQQLVDCDHGCDPQEPQACDSGCNGGLPSTAMDYVLKNGGIDTEASYPYTAADGKCKAKKGKVGASISNFSYVSPDEEQIAAALVEYGPLSIGIDAAWMQSYLGGVACPWLCNKKMLDHGVLIVGYGKEGFSPIRLKREPYWIIKNSWGAGWGESGYYRICKDKGSCGLNTMVVSASA